MTIKYSGGPLARRADGHVFHCDMASRQWLGINGPVKRFFDIVFSATAVLFLLPLLVSIGLAVRATSSGSALFRQERIGRGGRCFRILKFRTMYADAEMRLTALLDSDAAAAREWNEYQKLRHDPRITPLGRLLRKTSLDELPQLLNVLTGDMSIVGQRPILPQQRAAYGSHFVCYCVARPGITGLWQVSGRNALPFSKRAELGTEYISNWSLWSELKIILRTVPELLHPRTS